MAPRTHLTDKQIRAPYNKANATAIKAKIDDLDHVADTVEAGGSAVLSQIHHVRGASTGAIANLAAFTVANDGITLIEGDRVLVKDQADAKYNGVYVVGAVAGGSAPLTRATDWDEATELKQGTLVHVAEGTANANLFFEITADFPMTVGTTHQHFTSVWTTSATLTADGPGRALMAAGYFDEATATDKIAAGALTTALLKAGAISADATGRALFASGVLDETTATTAFGAQAIVGSRMKNNTVTATQLAAVLCSAPTTRSGAGAIAITAPTCLFTSTGAGQALTIADGTFAGQRLTIVHVVDGGSGVITQTTGAKLSTPIATITLTAVYDTVTLEWSGSLWNPVAWSGTTAIVNT
jgi:hypothetical protein